MYDVEPVFRNIKYNQKMEYFLCRGKPMVKIKFGLTAITHNFVKIANWIKADNYLLHFKVIQLILEILIKLEFSY